MKTHNLKRFNKAPIALLMAAIATGQAVVIPRQSHAIVAVVTGGAAVPGLIVLGAGLALVPAGLIVARGNHPDEPRSAPAFFAGAIGALTGLGAVLAGIVILDESGAPTPDFQEITADEAFAAQITSQEMRAFNRPSALERVNAVSESIARGIADRKISDPREAMDFAHSEWSAAHEGGIIGDLVYSALTKRGAHALEKARPESARDHG